MYEAAVVTGGRDSDDDMSAGLHARRQPPVYIRGVAV